MKFPKSVLLLSLLWSSTVSGIAVQQRCIRIASYHELLIEVSKHSLDTHVLVYPLRAFHSTSIPRLVTSDAVDSHEGLSVCTSENHEADKCDGKDLGSFLYTVDKKSGIDKLFTEETITMGQSLTYVAEEGGVHCVVSVQDGDSSHVDGVRVDLKPSTDGYPDGPIVLDTIFMYGVSMVFFMIIGAISFCVLMKDKARLEPDGDGGDDDGEHGLFSLRVDELIPFYITPSVIGSTDVMMDSAVYLFYPFAHYYDLGVLLKQAASIASLYMIRLCATDSGKIKGGSAQNKKLFNVSMCICVFFAVFKSFVPTMRLGALLTDFWVDLLDDCCLLVLGLIRVPLWWSVYVTMRDNITKEFPKDHMRRRVFEACACTVCCSLGASHSPTCVLCRSAGNAVQELPSWWVLLPFRRVSCTVVLGT